MVTPRESRCARRVQGATVTSSVINHHHGRTDTLDRNDGEERKVRDPARLRLFYRVGPPFKTPRG